MDPRPYFFTIILEIDEKDKGLTRFGIKDTIAGQLEGGMEVGYWVGLVQNLEQGIDIEASKGAVQGEGGFGVANKEVVFESPDIWLDADTASVEGGEERFLPPVVVMRVTCNGADVCGDVGGPVTHFVIQATRSCVEPGPLVFSGKESKVQAERESNEMKEATKQSVWNMKVEENTHNSMSRKAMTRIKRLQAEGLRLLNRLVSFSAPVSRLLARLPLLLPTARL